MIYVGPAATRDQLLEYTAPLAQHVASSLTLVVGDGTGRDVLLREAKQRLMPPEHVKVSSLSLPGDASHAILGAAEQQPVDLVVFGRLRPRLTHLLPRSRSKVIAQRLQPSVLRIQGRIGPIRRILVASGGDFHTYDDVRVAAQIAEPLKAEITLMHVVSQQSLVFEGFRPRQLDIDEFLSGSSAEASTLRTAAATLRERGITVTLRGRSGPVLDELLDELRSGHYDMLVIGAHRIARPLDRMLLEDIAGELLDLSPVPVLVVKGYMAE